jgi:MFS family permease
MAWGMRGTIAMSLRADYFGRRHFGTIMGISVGIMMLGNVGGPIMAGALADLTGDFRLGFTILALLAGAGTFFYVWLRPPPPPRRLREATSTPKP